MLNRFANSLVRPLLGAAKPLIVALVLTVAGSQVGFANPPPVGSLTIEPPERTDGAIVMRWSGRVASPMAAQIRGAFEAHRDRGTRVVFKIYSGGGSVAEGERVIDVLREIRSTHSLETVVEQGGVCGSMCVFIYLQGQKRTAALSSLWLFHEVSHHDPKTHKIIRLDRPAWERLVVKYYSAAGVSSAWTERMKPLTVDVDYWQTGADLIRDNSGIVHVALGNQRDRLIADRTPPKPSPEAHREPPPAAPEAPARPVEEPKQPVSRVATSFETKGCRMLVPEKQIYVNAPCS